MSYLPKGAKNATYPAQRRDLEVRKYEPRFTSRVRKSEYMERRDVHIMYVAYVTDIRGNEYALYSADVSSSMVISIM